MKLKIEETENQNEQIDYGGIMFTFICLYLSSVISVICAIVVGDKYFDEKKESQEGSDLLYPAIGVTSFGIITVILGLIYKHVSNKVDESNTTLTPSENLFNGAQDDYLNTLGQTDHINDNSAE